MCSVARMVGIGSRSRSLSELDRGPGAKDQVGRSRLRYLVVVRPVTSIAVAVLLGVIVVAFVVKLAAGGLTP